MYKLVMCKECGYLHSKSECLRCYENEPVKLGEQYALEILAKIAKEFEE